MNLFIVLRGGQVNRWCVITTMQWRRVRDAENSGMVIQKLDNMLYNRKSQSMLGPSPDIAMGAWHWAVFFQVLQQTFHLPFPKPIDKMKRSSTNLLSLVRIAEPLPLSFLTMCVGVRSVPSRFQKPKKN